MPAKKKPTTKAAKAKKPVKRKSTSRKKAAPAKKPPAGLCVNCMPIGQTQVIAMLLVSVFALVSVLATATYKLQVQQAELDVQAQQIHLLQE